MSKTSALTILAATALLAGGQMPSLGHARGDNRKRYAGAIDNDPERCLARGMTAFDVDGVTIYAGTWKAAVKKARLLKLQSTQPLLP